MAHSEPITIQNALHKWKGADRTGKRQYATAWAECGIDHGNWGFGWIKRADYSLRFTPDTADLYGNIADDHALPVGKTYHLKVTGHALEATGLRAYARWPMNADCNVELGLSLLQGTYMFEGTIQGEGLIQGPKQYSYALWTDYAYTKDLLFERETPARKGQGATLDCAIQWRFRPNWQLKTHVVDLPGLMQWKDLPYTQANASSQRTQTDDQDFQRWQPLISGRESNHKVFNQTLPTRGEAELIHECGAWASSVGLACQFGEWLPKVGFGKTFDGWRLNAWSYPAQRILGLEVARNAWKVGLAMDHTKPGRAHMIQLQCAYHPGK